MIATLQWITFAVCAGLTVARLPSALRRENRSLFFIFASLTLAILLSIEGPYLAIDAVLGGTNIANLLLRFVIFGAVLALGIRITRGFGASREYGLLTGKPGQVALVLCSAAVLLAFLLTDTAGSSAGMHGVGDKSEANGWLMELYGAAGRLFPAYVSLVLIPATQRAVRSRLPVLVRLGALLLCVGSVAVIMTLSFPLLPDRLLALTYIINYTAILCFLAGLAVIWIAKLRARSRRKRSYSEK